MGGILAFTGHRPNKLGGYSLDNPLKLKIESKIREELIRIDPVCCISGMALGVDQWAAQACVDLEIPFIAAVPFEGQECKWPNYQQDTYYYLLSKAAKTIIVSDGGYAAYKMQVRNKWMVDRADKILAVWDGSSGGTANCVQYAESLNKEIIRINPQEL